MIDPDKRNAIFQLHQEGMSLREISRRLHVSRNAVRTIVRQQGQDRSQRAERQDSDRPRTAAASVPRVRRLDAANAREAGRGRRRSRSAIPR